MIIFGTVGIFVRNIGLPSGSVAFFRGIIGAVFLCAIMLIKGRKFDLTAIRKNLALLAASGVCIGINWILLFEAYRYTTVAAATVCYYLSPVFVIIASALLLGERLTLKKVLCAAVALCGVVLVSGVLTDGFGQLKGVLLAVGAAVFYSGVVMINKYLRDISSYDMTVVQLASAALTILPYTLFCEDLSPQEFTGKTLVLLLVLGAVHTGLAYVLYFGAVSNLPAQTAAIFSYIDPACAVIFSAILLPDPVTPYGIAGAVLVLGSTLFCDLPVGRKWGKSS